jgi:hypothetical protein
MNCAEIVRIAEAQIPIQSGASIRVVDPTGGTLRTSADVALLVIESGPRTDLILVGYVGIGPTPGAWVPDPALYPAWYAKYVDAASPEST